MSVRVISTESSLREPTFIGDAEKTLFFVRILQASAFSCEIGGDVLGGYSPYFCLVSAPLYFYQALIGSVSRFSLMCQAMKRSQVIDSIYWLGRSVLYFGYSVASMIEPFSANYKIAQVPLAERASQIFSQVVPTALLAISAVAICFESWGLSRTIQNYQHFTTLGRLEDKISFLRGSDDPYEQACYLESSFCSKTRYLELKGRIDEYLANQGRMEKMERFNQGYELVRLGKIEMGRTVLCRISNLIALSLSLAAGAYLLQSSAAVTAIPKVYLASAVIRIVQILFNRNVSSQRLKFFVER